ncbi:MAG: alpha/beta-hydrolase family protein, partial [Minisyncoccia bacterium]
GSLGSEDSAQIYSLLSDPISGALWAGPPFANSFWPAVIKGRNPGSPAYLPALEKGELVRVLNASETEVSEFSEWGPLKIVYLAHPSDAIVFFSPSLWYKEPDWLSQERGEDVSSYLKWYPFVTFFQVGLDMLVTTDVPYGHGHNYAPVDYMRAWMEFEDKSQWTKSEIQNIQKNLGLGSLNRD